MFRTLRNYFWWTYDRGSLHYDIMVTLILLFLFLAPHYIDFKDKPAPPVTLTSSEVLVKHALDGDRHMIFEIRASDLESSNDGNRLEAAQRIVESIAGPSTVSSLKPVLDTHGKTVAYDAAVAR
ncbi:MAG: hypothetical protein PW735_11145 [Acidobacteriaceae bacterium]|nr:hypothetical protein [Acidobacteriaceae bacterium]